MGQVSIRVFRSGLLTSIGRNSTTIFTLSEKQADVEPVARWDILMLSVAIFVNHIRTTKITQFSPLVIPLMAIFKRAVREPAREKGYGPSP